jgi:Fe-S-cluster containining protein
MSHLIDPEYEKLLQAAHGNRKENKPFLEKLKKQKPKDLDIITNDLHDKAFEHIDCLKCANCCATTGPLLKTRDIKNLSSEFKIRPSEFTEKFLKMDEDGDWVFKKLPCPFLENDNCCSVYSYRPSACKDYPHTQERNIAQKLPITFLNSMICPAVAEVVENLKKHYSK